MEEERLSNMEKEVLLALKEHGGEASPDKLVEDGMEMVKVMNASSWLQSKGLVKIREGIEKSYSLTKEGEKFLKEGLPEKNLLKKLLEGGAWRQRKRRHSSRMAEEKGMVRNRENRRKKVFDYNR